MAKILLGFNCNCFTNRYDEPSEWTRLCSELGVRNVMFNIDLIDPWWSWDVQKHLCDETLNECARRGISIRCSFGGHHGHQHYLGHPDKAGRRQAEKFFRRAIRQTAYLGGKSFGTCFAIQTVRSNNDPDLRKKNIEDALAAYERLARYAKRRGLKALAYEMTSIPRETCANFEENDYVLKRGQKFAIPLRVCLDLGHRNMGGTPEEQDHLAWIRRYGKYCDVIDCQQSDLSGSHHWPFTEENNRRGIIRGDEVVRAIEESGAEEIMLTFELRCPAYFPQENKFTDNLAASVAYWRKWVKD